MENWIRISDRTPCIGEEIVIRFHNGTKSVSIVTEENYNKLDNNLWYTILPKITKPILELEDDQLISLYNEIKGIIKYNILLIASRGISFIL